jgi:hypothetical protein
MARVWQEYGKNESGKRQKDVRGKMKPRYRKNF